MANKRSRTESPERTVILLSDSSDEEWCIPPTPSTSTGRKNPLYTGRRARKKASSTSGFVPASSLLDVSSSTVSACPRQHRACKCKEADTSPSPRKRKQRRKQTRTTATNSGNASYTTDPDAGGAANQDDGTLQALDLVSQMEKDEELARKLQEDMDRQYAATLAATPATPPSAQHLGGNDLSPVRLSVRTRGNSSRVSWSHSPTEIDTAHIQELLREAGGLGGFDLGARPTNGRRRTQRRRQTGRNIIFNFNNLNQTVADGNDYEELLALDDQLGLVASRRGLTMEQISRLPVKTYTPGVTSSVEEAQCHVCMCDYEGGDSLRMLTCFHSFHCGCIDKWIKDNATCPVCRLEIEV